MINKLLISKCEYVSSLIQENINNTRNDETIIAYSSNVLRYTKKYIDLFDKRESEELEELNIFYQKAFNDYIEFQTKRMERVI